MWLEHLKPESKEAIKVYWGHDKRTVTTEGLGLKDIEKTRSHRIEKNKTSLVTFRRC